MSLTARLCTLGRSTLRSSLIALALGVMAASVARGGDVPVPPPTAGSAAAAEAPGGVPPHRTLDLTPPDLRKLFSAEELETPLADPEPQMLAPESETVHVKGLAPPSDVPLGLGSVWWALWHPTRAWRILTPVQ